MRLDPFMILKKVADYQFGYGAGDALFPSDLISKMEVKYSRKSGKIRYVFLDNKTYVTFRASDGFIVSSLEAAANLIKNMRLFKYAVQVDNLFVPMIFDIRRVLVKHIKRVDPNIEAGSEVIVIDENNNIVGVGRAILSGEEMQLMKRGVAVKLRKINRER
jgi:predicted RNA-binding protein (TIGR00451 family)